MSGSDPFDSGVGTMNGRTAFDDRRIESSRSDHVGACGHELDAWETHLEHRPDCPRELCADDRCDCPEMCAGCCRACRQLDGPDVS